MTCNHVRQGLPEVPEGNFECERDEDCGGDIYVTNIPACESPDYTPLAIAALVILLGIFLVLVFALPEAHHVLVKCVTDPPRPTPTTIHTVTSPTIPFTG